MRMLENVEDLDEIERLLIPGMAFDLMFEEMIDCINGGMLAVDMAERILRKIFAVLIPAARAMINEWDRDMVMELELKNIDLNLVHVNDMMRMMLKVVGPADAETQSPMYLAQSQIAQYMIENKNRKIVYNQVQWWHEEMHAEFVEGDDIVKLMVVDLVERVVDVLVAMQYMDTLRRLYPQIIWMSEGGSHAAAIRANIEARAKQMQIEKGLWRVEEVDNTA